MGKLSVFNFVTLNGFYKGPGGDISWHKHDEEGGKMSEENLKSNNILLFGRVTYEMMANFWPSPMAHETFPDVAEGMNNAEKIVFSKTLQKADWKNTRVVKNNIVEEIRKLKQQGKDITILGSGSIVSLFAEHGLIDDYQFMLDPVAIADGTPIFKGINHQLNLKLIDTKIFKSGSILLSYQTI
ncbi:MAG: dihydrofolate reductase [Chitinophagaceae bacterium]|nr:dihydrofolate reductase [Chitinophagaceae bacterium]